MKEKYSPRGKDSPHSLETALGSGYEGENLKVSRLTLMLNVSTEVTMLCSHNQDTWFFKRLPRYATVTLNLRISSSERTFSVQPASQGSE